MKEFTITIPAYIDMTVKLVGSTVLLSQGDNLIAFSEELLPRLTSVLTELQGERQ